jgi:hypothetical protein
VRLALLCLLLASLPASAQEVARLFGAPVSAEEIRLSDEASLPQAAQLFRQRVLKEAMPRFIAAHQLQATPEEIAQYQRWEAEFKRIDLKRRVDRLAQIDRELQASTLDEKKRKALEQHRDVLRSLAKHDAEYRGRDAAASGKVHAMWIEGYKLKKALYEKYGGRVGISKWGPDPAGATEALLREHEKNGELQISHGGLAQEFWSQLAREPRMPASKPEHRDFSYYWLKPPAQAGR